MNVQYNKKYGYIAIDFLKYESTFRNFLSCPRRICCRQFLYTFQTRKELGMGDVLSLIEEVELGTGLTITRDEAMRVLARDAEGQPELHDFRHFYTDDEDIPQCLLGRVLARQTSVVWSTGGHTTEPALTFGSGPGAEGLRGVYLNTHICSVIKKALTH